MLALTPSRGTKTSELDRWQEFLLDKDMTMALSSNLG